MRKELYTGIYLEKKKFKKSQSYYYFTTPKISILIPKINNKFGIINVSGKKQSVFKFEKKLKKNIKKINLKKNSRIPLNQTMNINKLKKILK